MEPLLLILIVAAAVYLGSCWAHPFRACTACARSKESHSKMFKGAFGACPSCRGVGHHVRWGARILGKG